MKTTILFFVLIAIGLVLCSSRLIASPSDSLIVNLAKEETGILLNLPIKAGTYIVVIKNKLPGKEYDIKIELEDEEIAPLSTESLLGDIVKAFDPNPPCSALKDLLDGLDALEDESLLPQGRSELLTLLPKCEKCNDDYQRAEKMLLFFDYYYKVKIGKGQVLKITVKRKNKEDKELEWRKVFKTPSRGKWLTSYSFNFVPTSWDSKEALYFAKSVGMDSFFITRENTRKWVDFVPGVTFTWLSAKGASKDFAFGGSGGIGFDLEKPVIYAGLSLIYNQNLSLTVGAAAHRIKQLNGKYNEGDLIRENLTPDQLMIDPYRFHPFVSLSLRFDKNPFTIGKPAEAEK